ncbi:capsular polysaccharide export protein [Pararhizobium capsulatum DSM 1112]|uniref:Capsular polysaccharide export protein n=1 Tax=Pararhizobium capsulatum DSM 1112 TaxID=1121113 RepID=A0ABU0BL04_9HYPH|nr:capsular biosynthesis protein [Pararhizobium capsulatum]MDQ0318925.1 capsular polysaccharide export protein [Pararhizobium capsulatum DSM 1112]
MPASEAHSDIARVFLFLQGPSSSLFTKIADQLELRGHRCLRVNLNVGDQIFWRRRNAHAYRGKGGEHWRQYLDRFMHTQGVTDLVLLGEERPYHRIAVALAGDHDIDVTVIEMGYLRPDWLTIERNGMSSNSHFPIAPDYIVEAAKTLPEPDWKRRYRQTFMAEAAYDLLYNLPNVFLSFLYPHYHRHALFHPLAEYAGWLMRLAGGKRRQKAAEAAIHALKAEDTPFFVYPLQLQTDYQLRAHSSYNDQREAIDDVLRSFAGHAPANARLAVKIHPLDNGLINWQRFIVQRSAKLGLLQRIVFLDGGNLDEMLLSCRGVVTVNSTVGLNALQKGVPVKVLGSAIFNMAGLTDQRSLDEFWEAPRPPEELLRTAFFRLVAATIQVRGNFYSKRGTDAGAAAIAERLDARTINEPGAFVKIRPRLRPVKRQQG